MSFPSHSESPISTMDGKPNMMGCVANNQRRLALYALKSSLLTPVAPADDQFCPSRDNITRKRKFDDENDYFESLPPGYRFCPKDDELIRDYLKPKVFNWPLPQNQIIDVNIYLYNPDILAEIYKQFGEKEWYFFTPRERKYPNGSRPNRGTDDGYWKATGADKQVKDTVNTVIGFKKSLVFYKGKAPNGDKTNWIMHEYRINNPPLRNRMGENDMRLDDWVLCRIYKKIYADKSKTHIYVDKSKTHTQEDDQEEEMRADESTTSLPSLPGESTISLPACNSNGSPQQSTEQLHDQWFYLSEEGVFHEPFLKKDQFCNNNFWDNI